jgi:hypothetical protein
MNIHSSRCSCAFSSCIELPRLSFANCHLQSMPIRLSFANCHLRSMTEEALLQSSLEQLRSVVTAMHLLSAAFLLVALLQSGRAERPSSSSRILALRWPCYRARCASYTLPLLPLLAGSCWTVDFSWRDSCYRAGSSAAKYPTHLKQ